MTGWRGRGWQRALWVTLGLLLWTAGAFVLRDVRAAQRFSTTALATTSHASTLEALAVDEPVRLAWHPGGCTVQALDGGAIDVLGAPSRAGWQRVVRRFVCEEGGAPFFIARAVRAIDGPTRVRAPIAEAHIDGRAFEQTMERALPPLIQRALTPEIERAGRTLQQVSRGWKIPPQILEEVRVGEATRVRVEQVRVRLDDRGVRVRLSLDASVVLEMHQRPVFRPGKRGTRVIPVHIHERFSTVEANFVLGDWPGATLESLRVTRDGCTVSDVPVVSRFVSLDRLCNDLLRDFQPRMESELRRYLRSYLQTLGASVDVDALVRERLTASVEGWGLPERAQRWWRDAAIGVGEVTQDASGLRVRLVSNAAWATYAPVAGFDVPNTDADVDVGVSAVAVQSLITAMVEQPFDVLWDAAQSLDAPALRAPLARMQSMMDRVAQQRGQVESADDEKTRTDGRARSRAVDASFALLGLRTHVSSVVRPRLWVEGPQHLGVMLADFDGLATKQGTAGIRFQVWASLRWTLEDESLRVRLLWNDRSSHDGGRDDAAAVAVLPVAVDAFGVETLERADRRRLEAQVGLLRELLAREEAVSAVEGEVVLPELSIRERAPWLRTLGADATHQAFYIGVRLSDVLAAP